MSLDQSEMNQRWIGIFKLKKIYCVIEWLLVILLLEIFDGPLNGKIFCFLLLIIK